MRTNSTCTHARRRGQDATFLQIASNHQCVSLVATPEPELIVAGRPLRDRLVIGIAIHTPGPRAGSPRSPGMGTRRDDRDRPLASRCLPIRVCRRQPVDLSGRSAPLATESTRVATARGLVYGQNAMSRNSFGRLGQTGMVWLFDAVLTVFATLPPSVALSPTLNRRGRTAFHSSNRRKLCSVPGRRPGRRRHHTVTAKSIPGGTFIAKPNPKGESLRTLTSTS